MKDFHNNIANMALGLTTFFTRVTGLNTNHAYRETRVSTVTLNSEEQDWRRFIHPPALIGFNYEGTSLALPARRVPSGLPLRIMELNWNDYNYSYRTTE